MRVGVASGGMNLAPTPKQALLAAFAAFAAQATDGGHPCITARHEHGAKGLEVERPTLAVLLQGRKRIAGATLRLELVPGDLLVITRRCQLDVVNIPDPDSGLYLSVLGPLCDEVMAAARLLWEVPINAQGDDIARFDVADFVEPLRRWLHAQQAGQETESRVAMLAVVLELCRRGHASMLLPPPPNLAAQLRAMVAEHPARNWQSQDVEDRLGLSGPTLRRRLAAEGTSLREIIASARLACAIELLYTTRWPVKTVAAKVGYRSVSSFVHRFHDRYGLDPAQIGNAAA